MHSLLFILSVITLNVLAQEIVTLFTIPPDVDVVTILGSDETATTYSYRASCSTESSASPTISSLSAISATASGTGNVSRPATATGSGTVSGTIIMTAFGTATGSGTVEPNQKRQAAASCDVGNITQGPSTWEAHYAYHFSPSGLFIQGEKVIRCTFGSGGFGKGSAACTESTSGMPTRLSLTTKLTTTYSPAEYIKSTTAISAVTSDTTIITLDPPTTTTASVPTSSSSGVAGAIALPTKRAMAFAGGAAGLLVLGAGLAL